MRFVSMHPKWVPQQEKSDDSLVNTSAESVLTAEGDSFRELMRCARDGSEEAAWKLLNRYEGHVLRAVRRVLHRAMRPKFDSIDFVQMAWKSLFRAREQFDRFDNPQHFVKYLIGIACNKVLAETRQRLRSKKHNVRREEPLGRVWQEAVGREPSPMDVAIARERWEKLLEDQPAHYREIIKLRLAGHTFVDIGKRLEIDPQTARRFLIRMVQQIGVR
jgi:RNA polymerase sigma factor (sigma-70 family)